MELKNTFRRLSAVVALGVSLAATGMLNAQVTVFTDPQSLTFNYQFGSTIQPVPVDITVVSSPTVLFNVNLTTTSGGNWLSATPLRATTPDKIKVFVSTTQLPLGEYTGNIAISGDGFALVNIPVRLRITDKSELSINPAGPLTFTATVGSGTQSKLLTMASSGSPLNYTTAINTNGTGNWLAISPTSGTTETPSGTIVVTVNPAGLAIGTYRGFMSADAAGSTSSQPVTKDFILNIVAAPQVTATPSTLSFNFQSTSGAPIPAAQTLSINSNSGATSFAAVASVDLVSDPAWLAVSPGGGTTPASLSVTVNPANLTPGPHAGKITITAQGSPNPTIIPVTLTVSNLPLLNLQPSSLLFTAQVGQVQGQTVLISTTSGNLNYGITKSVDSPWLNFAFQGQPFGIATTTPSPIVVQISALPVGTYTGSLTVTSTSAGNPTQIIPITVVVSAAVTLNVNPNALSFTATANGTPPAAKTFDVASSDSTTPIPFAITTSTTDGGTWLSTNVASGVTPLTGVGVNINQGGLLPGNYTGKVTVTGTGIASATSQVVNVSLTVTPSAFNVTPTSLTFNQVTGGLVPPNQSINISSGSTGATVSAVINPNPQSVFTIVSLSSPQTPSTLTIGVANNTLSTGTYTGTLILTGTAGQTSIPLTLLVGSAPPLILTPATLNFDFQLGGAVPAAKTIAVTTNGNAVPFNTSAATSSGGTWLAVIPASSTTPSQLSVSVNPSGLAAGTYNGTITTTPTGAGAGPAAVANVRLVVGAPAPPVLTGFTNAASFASVPAVPGMIVTLFGTGMGPTNVVSATAAGGFFETKISDTRVLFDNVPAPLIYVSARQVSAIVPYTLFGRLSTSVQVEYLGVRSSALIQRVENSQPGLFSADSSGRGAGAILNQDNSLNTSNNPATKTQAIVLYATGEGQTTPEGIDGKIIGSDLRKSRLPVTVKVGGVDCVVEYAGSAPGLVSGVFQVNVRLNNNVPSGAVPVVLQVGTAISQDNLTVVVR